jgi:Na+/H+ antiporter NhaD/arsenite permease-like protein
MAMAPTLRKSQPLTLRFSLRSAISQRMVAREPVMERFGPRSTPINTALAINDATAVVLTPAILVAIRKARVAPLPYLFACAMIANAASFVLPISNPANLVVFRLQMPPLGRWLLSFGLPSILSIAATYLVLRFVFRRELAALDRKMVTTVPMP